VGVGEGVSRTRVFTGSEGASGEGVPHPPGPNTPWLAATAARAAEHTCLSRRRQAYLLAFLATAATAGMLNQLRVTRRAM